MVEPFYCEQAVKVGDESFRLVINFHTLDAVEGLLRKDFNSILTQIGAGSNAPLSMQAGLIWGLLREHHPEVSIDQAMTLTRGEVGVAFGLALNKLVETAFPAPEAPKKGKGKNPPRRRGASKPS